MKYLAKTIVSKPDGTYESIEDAFWGVGDEVNLPQANLDYLESIGVLEKVEEATEKTTEKTTEGTPELATNRKGKV